MTNAARRLLTDHLIWYRSFIKRLDDKHPAKPIVEARIKECEEALKK